MDAENRVELVNIGLCNGWGLLLCSLVMDAGKRVGLVTVEWDGAGARLVMLAASWL